MKRATAILVLALAGCHFEYNHSHVQGTTTAPDVTQVELHNPEVKIGHEGGNLVLEHDARTVVLKDAASLGKVRVDDECETTNSRSSFHVKATFPERGAGAVLEWDGDTASFRDVTLATKDPGTYTLAATTEKPESK